jgi:hypothetical protein
MPPLYQGTRTQKGYNQWLNCEQILEASTDRNTSRIGLSYWKSIDSTKLISKIKIHHLNDPPHASVWLRFASCWLDFALLPAVSLVSCSSFAAGCLEVRSSQGLLPLLFPSCHQPFSLGCFNVPLWPISTSSGLLLDFLMAPSCSLFLSHCILSSKGNSATLWLKYHQHAENTHTGTATCTPRHTTIWMVHL